MLETTHKLHFRLKIRQILTRLIRKFGYDTVEALIPESDHKLIVNMRKEKERSMKKKAAASASASSKTAATAHSGARGFDDLMNDEDDEGEEHEKLLPQFSELDVNGKKQRGRKGTLVIKEDSEDVLDFLSSNALSKIGNTTTSSGKKGQKPNKPHFEYKTESSGKMLIADSDDEEEERKRVAKQPEDFYMQAVKGKGEDAFERLPNGQIKFVKKRNREADEIEEEGVKDAKKRSFGKEDAGISKMLGRQYKSNVILSPSLTPT